MDIDKLELSIETLRELNDDELTHVAGGARPDTVVCLTGNETYFCPTIGQGWPHCAIAVTGVCG